MTPQPLPDNLHPSQCYRLLDRERDTLQEGDEEQSEMDASYWDKVEPNLYGKKPTGLFNYRRPFTPPAPVQVQEFWRLLEVGKDTLQAGDQVLFRLGHDGWKWEPVHESRIGCVPCVNHTYRRRVTVPVAAPAPVADADVGKKETLTIKKVPISEIIERIEKCLNVPGFPQKLWAKTALAEDAPKPDPSGDYGNYRQRLFNYIDNTFGRAPLGSEMDEFEHIVLGYYPNPNQAAPYLVSVDGQSAPRVEHDTVEEARTEAERLAKAEHPAQVRLLRQVGAVKAEMTVKWGDKDQEEKP